MVPAGCAGGNVAQGAGCGKRGRSETGGGARLPIIFYSGYRDGNFSFGMRTHPERSDLRILRADKVVLHMAVYRDWGVGQAGLNQQQVVAMLKRDGVGMVVSQRKFYADIVQMRQLEAVLSTDAFRRLDSFPVTGQLSTQDGRNVPGGNMVDSFVPAYKVLPPPSVIAFDIPFAHLRIDRSLPGH
jgi:hypothetical protein